MKKRVCACLLACLLCLSGCGREPEEASGWTALQMARAILASQGAAEAVTDLVGADFAADAGQCSLRAPRQGEDEQIAPQQLVYGFDGVDDEIHGGPSLGGAGRGPSEKIAETALL